MGGHVSYFQDIVLVNMGGGYKVKLRGFTNWAKYIMPLDRFAPIRFAFHHEVEKLNLPETRATSFNVLFDNSMTK